MIQGKADIYLLGSGIKSIYHITLETRLILSSCKELYYYHDLPSLEEYFRSIHPEPVNLLERFYIDGMDRGEIYSSTVAFVIERAMANPGIAFITHGHPLVGSTISQLLIEAAGKNGLNLEILSAVSCFDSIVTDLRIDPIQNGLMIIEASDLLGHSEPMNPHIDCILMQIADIGSPVASRKKEHGADRLSELKAYLLRYYPSDHQVSIIESSVEVGFPGEIRTVALRKLDGISFTLLYNHSLYIPALPRC